MAVNNGKNEEIDSLSKTMLTTAVSVVVFVVAVFCGYVLKMPLYAIITGLLLAILSGVPTVVGIKKNERLRSFKIPASEPENLSTGSTTSTIKKPEVVSDR